MDKNFRTTIKNNTMMNYASLANIEKLTTYTVKNKIQGDFVECGVWRGGCSALVASVLLKSKVEKTLHLFDSFDDPCEPMPADGEKIKKLLGYSGEVTGKLIATKGYYKKIGKGGPGKEKEVNALLTKTVGYTQDKVKIYKGWFEHTVPIAAPNIDAVSFFILDCGFYSANKVCMDFLYKKVVSGGVVLIDNYYTSPGCKLAIDQCLAKLGEKQNIIKFNKDCIYWIKK